MAMTVPDPRPNRPQAPIDIDLLRTFLAIAETTSFSKAAERVFRTPSAVSMQMKKLEDLLGVAVFTRDSRSVALTPEGELLVGYARRILALSNEMMARFVMPDVEGTVRLGAADDHGERLLPLVLTRFAQTHPNVAVDVVIENSDQLQPRFERGDLDVVIHTARPDSALPADSTVLMEEQLVWAGLKGGCAWEREPLPVSMWEEGCAWRANAVQALAEMGREFRIAYMSAHTAAQRAALHSDLAVAPLPASCVQPPLICLGERQGLPKLGTYQSRMRVRPDAGECSRAVAEHVVACYQAIESGDLQCA
jgi:DNA-binding transcriptional LysR family regulator